jgi:DNA-binding transcriptional regulator GbsR (MarR family)
LLLEKPANPEEEYAQERMKDMYELMEMLTVWTEEVQRLDKSHLNSMLKLGSNIGKVLDMKDKIFSAGKKT